MCLMVRCQNVNPDEKIHLSSMMTQTCLCGLLSKKPLITNIILAERGKRTWKYPQMDCVLCTVNLITGKIEQPNQSHLCVRQNDLLLPFHTILPIKLCKIMYTEKHKWLGHISRINPQICQLTGDRIVTIITFHKSNNHKNVNPFIQ